MKRLDFKIGDTAWFAEGKEELSSGEVVHAFTLHGETLYVLAIATSIDDIYEVRCGLTLSDAKDAPLGMWRGLGARKPRQ